MDGIESFVLIAIDGVGNPTLLQKGSREECDNTKYALELKNVEFDNAKDAVYTTNTTKTATELGIISAQEYSDYLQSLSNKRALDMDNLLKQIPTYYESRLYIF